MHNVSYITFAPQQQKGRIHVAWLLAVAAAISAVALIVWGHWLAGATIMAAIALIIRDNRRMTTQADREARDPQNRPFPDFEKWKSWDSNV